MSFRASYFQRGWRLSPAFVHRAELHDKSQLSQCWSPPIPEHCFYFYFKYCTFHHALTHSSIWSCIHYSCIHTPTHPSIYPSIHTPNHPCIHPSSTNLSTHQCVQYLLDASEISIILPSDVTNQPTNRPVDQPVFSYSLLLNVHSSYIQPLPECWVVWKILKHMMMSYTPIHVSSITVASHLE